MKILKILDSVPLNSTERNISWRKSESYPDNLPRILIAKKHGWSKKTKSGC